MLRRFIYSIILALFASQEATSFEVDGFRSGMSVDDALVLIKNIDNDATLKDVDKSIIHKFDKSNKIIEEWYFLFCNDELASVHKSYKFTWDAAVKAISKNDENYGPGSYQIWDNNLMNLKFESLNFHWEDAYDNVTVLLSGSNLNDKLWDGGKLNVHNNVGHISEMYSINNIDKHCNAPMIRFR